MKEQDLCQLLEQLQTEIERTEAVDIQERRLLQELEGDIRELLERCDDEDIQTHPLTVRRFDEAVEALAVNYPTLTALITNVSTILSNAGI